MFAALLAVFRLLGFILLFTAICIAVPLTNLILGREHGFRVHRLGMHLTHLLLGIKVRMIGTLPETPALIFLNHPSYLDIFFNTGKRPAVMVAAEQFKNWPFIGWLGCSLKTIWVKRHCAEAGKNLRKEIVNRFQTGMSIYTCPEGRTSGSHDIYPVKPGLFVEAVRNDIPVVFFSIRYGSERIPYFHDLKAGFLPHFFRHLWNLFKMQKIQVDIRISRAHSFESVEEGMRDYYRFHAWHLRRVLTQPVPVSMT